MRTTIPILMAVALLLSACSTSDVPAESSETPDTPEETGPSDEPGEAAPDEPETPGEDVRSEFESLFSKAGSSWMVTYEMTTNAPGSDYTGDLTMTQYVEGTDRFRTDASVQGSESRTYLIDGTVTVCVSTDDWMCFASDLDESIEAQASIEEGVESGSYDITDSESRVIAGTNARCYTFDTEEGAGEYCFSPEGVPLFVSVSAEGVTTEMVATDYSTSLPAGVWELPAEPGSMPGFGDFDPSAYT